MQSMVPCHDFFGRHQQMFDPFSLYFWDGFPHDFPFRSPMTMMGQPRPFMPQPFMLQMMTPQMPQMTMPKMKSKIEYKETPEVHLFMADLPGLQREDVDVHVEEGKLLHISAKKKHNREENGENYCYVERGGGAFVTRFMLPPNAKPEHMRTCVDHGVLTVTIPKQIVDSPSYRGPQIDH